MTDPHSLANFIWDIADLLRGPYRPPQYERVMLPLVVLRRFDCVLAATKPRVLAEYEARKDKLQGEALDAKLNSVAGQRFHNHSPLDFEKLKGDPDNIDKHLVSYIEGFSQNVRTIFSGFEFAGEIERMREANILYLVVSKFCDVDLRPGPIGNPIVDNIQMGLLFEDLIRRFNEAANETAGDHFTPREVIRLMVDILFAPDDEILTTPGTVKKMLDPACGTGGMLSEAQSHLFNMNPNAQLWVFGQDINPRSYAVAASDLLIKGNENSQIELGDSLINDQYGAEKFDYFLANPPFGVDWKRQQAEVKRESERMGFAGRFGAGLPRVSDGSLLFLQHMMSKFIPFEAGTKDKTGSRLAIVFNGSPLFSGGAGSGESEIRKWVIENDWLEAIIALPDQMFYNTGIGTYIWVVTNRKELRRKGKVQLVDARGQNEEDAKNFWVSMRRSLGDKRRRIGGSEPGDPDQIGYIVKLHGNFEENKYSKIFDNDDFGYQRVPIERPLRLLYQMTVEKKSNFLDAVPHLLDDVQAVDRELGREPRPNWSNFDNDLKKLLERRASKWKAPEHRLFRDVFTERVPGDKNVMPVTISGTKKKSTEDTKRVWGWFPVMGQKDYVERYEADSQLRDAENIRIKDNIENYVHIEVIQHLEDAWADREKIVRAYEINFNRHFYTYIPPRPLSEIDVEIKQMEEEIVRLLREVTV